MPFLFLSAKKGSEKMKILVYEEIILNVFADRKKHVSYNLVGEFLNIAQASKFITEQCKVAGNKKFILREV